MSNQVYWAEIPNDAKPLLKDLAGNARYLEASGTIFLFIGRYGSEVVPMNRVKNHNWEVSPILVPDNFVYAYVTLRRLHKDLATVYEIFTEMVNQ